MTDGRANGLDAALLDLLASGDLEQLPGGGFRLTPAGIAKAESLIAENPGLLATAAEAAVRANRKQRRARRARREVER